MLNVDKEMKILLVDDMKTLLMISKRHLANFGFSNIDLASNGAEALKIIEESFSSNEPYKLVISDITMPQMTGLELLEKVRSHENEEIKKLKLIICSAEGEKQSVEEAQALKCNGYITKPFKERELQVAIQMAFMMG